MIALAPLGLWACGVLPRIVALSMHAGAIGPWRDDELARKVAALPASSQRRRRRGMTVTLFSLVGETLPLLRLTRDPVAAPDRAVLCTQVVLHQKTARALKTLLALYELSEEISHASADGDGSGSRRASGRRANGGGGGTTAVRRMSASAGAALDKLRRQSGAALAGGGAGAEALKALDPALRVELESTFDAFDADGSGQVGWRHCMSRSSCEVTIAERTPRSCGAAIPVWGVSKYLAVPRFTTAARVVEVRDGLLVLWVL